LRGDVLILVTSAFGNQGKKLIPKLAAAGAIVRALRVSAGGEAELKSLGAAEVMIGDASDPMVLREALRNVSSVYHVGPSAHPRERQMGLAMVDAAVAAGIKHLVFSSVLHAILTGLIQHKLKRDIEEYLISAPINFTILQPADYMQVQRIKGAFEMQQFVLAWSLDSRQSMVDLEDVTDVAAKVLLEGEPHYGATYELSAPGCFTAYEIGDIIARITGKPISVVETSPEARMRDHLSNRLLEDDIAYQLSVFQALRKWYSGHDFVGNPMVLTMLLGRKPTSLEDYIAREYAKFHAAA
jgi:uncharacterized protein YbjT (DUF2867 family)